MDKSSLPVHEVELDIEPAPGGLYGRGVGDHADAPGDLGQAAVRHCGHGAGVDTDFEAGRGPLHKLDCPLGLHDLDSRVDVLRHRVPSEEQHTGHVLSFKKLYLRPAGKFKECVGWL